MTITTLIIAATVATMDPSPADQERLCYSMSEFHMATVEAREKGAPIDKVFEFVRQTDDGTETGRILIAIMRDMVVKVYSQPNTGERFTPAERQRLKNYFTAQCVAGWNDEPWERAQ